MSAALPEKDIVSLFQQLSASPDQAAFWQLHAHYFHRLYPYVLNFVRLKEAAEEITNDVFVDIWQRRHVLGNVTQPEMYLFVCAKNKAILYLKKKALAFDSIDSIHEQECVLEMNPFEQLVSNEMLKHINQAIAALPSKCRMIFRLVKENNLKYREVAELLDLSEKTVENQMAIALKKLTAAIRVKLV